MPRVKRGTKRNDRRKKILKRASGYFLTKSKLYQAAQEAVERGLKFAYSGRKQKKRQYRSLWIVRINAAAKLNGISYSLLINGLKKGRRRARSQDPGRPRRPRRTGLHRACYPGQGRPRQARSRLSEQSVGSARPKRVLFEGRVLVCASLPLKSRASWAPTPSQPQGPVERSQASALPYVRKAADPRCVQEDHLQHERHSGLRAHFSATFHAPREAVCERPSERFALLCAVRERSDRRTVHHPKHSSAGKS